MSNRLSANGVNAVVRRAIFGDEWKEPARTRPVHVGLPKTHAYWWDVSGDCLEPAVRELYGRPWADHASGPRAPVTLRLRARCRSCAKCRWQTQKLWYGRGLGELRQATIEDRRTWFVTFTFNPEQRTLARMRAHLAFNEGGKAQAKDGSLLDYDRLSESEQFKEIHSVISKELTLWLKRVRMSPVVNWRYKRRMVKEAYKRKNDRAWKLALDWWEHNHPCPSPAKLRYLLVTEAHKKSEVFPHYHMLLHELDTPVLEYDLRTHWRSRMGFCEAKLVKGEIEKALYLVKYISKSRLARVRASQKYGRQADKTPEGPRKASKAATVNQNTPLNRKITTEMETSISSFPFRTDQVVSFGNNGTEEILPCQVIPLNDFQSSLVQPVAIKDRQTTTGPPQRSSPSDHGSSHHPRDVTTSRLVH